MLSTSGAERARFDSLGPVPCSADESESFASSSGPRGESDRAGSMPFLPLSAPEEPLELPFCSR